MNRRAACPWATSAIAFDIRVAHSAPETFGGSPIVPRNFSAGWSRIRPTSNSPRAVGACELRATAYARTGSRVPTNTRSPSRISREAAATIISCAVWSLIAEVRGCGRPGRLDTDRFDVDATQIGRAVFDVEDPFLQPRREAFDAARPRGVVAIERVVALEVPLHRRGVGAARLVHHRDDLRLRDQDAVWVAQCHGRGHPLLPTQHHRARGTA